MSDFEAMKRRAINAALQDATGAALTRLADRVEQHVPDEMVFTKAELVVLLRAMAEEVS